MTKINKPQIKIVNCSTGEEIIRDATNEEIAQLEINSANDEKRKTEEEAKATQRQAILDRLGLTSEEASLLLS
jgi:uncharacterized protein (UPF0371 family)